MLKQLPKRINKKGWGERFALAMTVTLLWSVVLICKGIYPFGSQSLMVGDGSGQVLPAYVHVWDALHGQKSLFYDWYSGLGNNMAGMALEFALVSPLNLFFLFIRRASIEAAMPALILVKLMAMGLGMQYVLKRWFPELSPCIRVLFCVLYVFSPFNMEYYHVSRWAEMSIMFPILMYGYFRLMKEGKRTAYIICLALTTMLSFQNIYMLMVMLLILTGFLPLLDKGYKERLGTLLWSTVVALMISSWLWIPGGLQIARSDRISYQNSLIDIWRSVWILHPAKWMKLYNAGIPLSLFMMYGFRNRKSKSTFFFLGILAMLCAPIIMESTNLLWHGGSYMGFTMRFSYMLTFWVVVAGAYAYNSRVTVSNTILEKPVTGIFVAAAGIGCSILFYYSYINDETTVKQQSSAIPVILLVIALIVLGIILCYQKETGYQIATWFIVLTNTLSLALVSVYAQGNLVNTYASISNQVIDDQRRENNPLLRIKTDGTLENNYPLIMGKNAASSFQPFNSKQQVEEMVWRGYSSVGIKMCDSGGTLFTDALMGVRQIFSNREIDENLYTKVKSYSGYTLCNSNYYYDYGIKLQNAPGKVEWDGNPFIYQNRLAEAIVGDPLLDTWTLTDVQSEIKIGDKGLLYLCTNDMERCKSISVWNVEGKARTEIDCSASRGKNEILCLGVYENCSLQIRVNCSQPVDYIYYAFMPLDRFDTHRPETFKEVEVSRGKISLCITLNGAAKGEYLYLPLYPDQGWNCTVNGREINIESLTELDMVIPMEEGSNTIRLVFAPPGLYVGLLVSMVGILLFVFSLIKRQYFVYRGCEILLFVGAELILAVIVTGFYVIPFICMIVEICQSIIR